MKKKAKISSEARMLASIYRTARDLHRIGVMDKVTLRQLDPKTEAVEPIKAAEIRKIRETENVSHPVFALLLGTSISTVRQWERGEKKPSGMALRVLRVVQRHGLERLAL